ncbi:unnamed protein product, partial [Allacma fusca]
MPNYTCTVCLVQKTGDCKRLKRHTPYWDFHERNRSATLPPLQERGRICPSCYQKVYNYINPRGKAAQELVPEPAQPTVPTVQPPPPPVLPQAPGCAQTATSSRAHVVGQRSQPAPATTLQLVEVTAQEPGLQPVPEPSQGTRCAPGSEIEPSRTPPALGPGEILVRAVGRTNRICSVCGQEARQLSMQEVSGLLSACTWVAAETFLPTKNRICNVHVENGRLSQAALESLSKRSQMKVMTETKLLNHLKQIIISAVQFVPEVPKNALDFDSPLLTDSA